MPLAPRQKTSLVLALAGALLAGFLAGVLAGRAAQGLIAGWFRLAPDRLTLAQVSFAQLAGWNADPLNGVGDAFSRSCNIFRLQKPEAGVGPGGRYGAARDWVNICDRLNALPKEASAGQLRAFFEQNFVPLAAGNHTREAGKFTGYYEPELHGSLTRQGAFQEPLLAAPAGLITVNLGDFNPKWRGQRISGRVKGASLQPLQARSRIVAGALKAEKLELLYVDDPVDAFFLHIQGSGRVRLIDGRVIRLGYAGQNGHPYVAIGKTLVQSGALPRDNVSMQSIRAWLSAHPDERDKIMATNPSYVFFRALEGGDPELGPPGAQNVPLTPGRSLAIDTDFHALGAPVWLDSAAPSGDNGELLPLRRLMVAQDTGGAIRGPVRGDVFWGFGERAEDIAGRMNSEGRMYILLPREIAARAVQESN
ncbi:MAG: murein transglycosylase [Alphaproteobacteria bacterium]|nr:murein transglycosylase [Alphaproteobacteria bacterium]